MNPRTTWWLTVLAVGLFAYIYFVDRRSASSVERSQHVAKLLPEFDPSKVSSVSITRTNETIRVELINDQWQLTNPSYPAQSTVIDSFLSSLTNLTRQNEIPAQEIISKSGGLSPFGLDPPLATIRIQAATNLLQLRVGAKTFLGDRVYVQPVGAAGIFTTDGALLQHLPTSASQWRNPLLVYQSNLSFDHIAITAGSRPLKLERDTNQLWRLLEPLPLRADFGRVEDLIRHLRSARVNQFVSDDPKTDLESFGLQAPEAEITLASGSNAVFQVQFGKSPTNDPASVYARCMAHTNIVLVSRELADLVERPYTEFRDHALISFRPSRVDRIEVRAEESFALQRQTNADWQIVEPFQAPADPPLMQLFLDNLSRLEIVRFEKEVVTDFAPYGLDRPSRQYALKTSVTNALGVTNQTLVQVDFGTNEVDKVYCRRSDEKSVYVVPFADMFRLERAAFALRDRRIWNFASNDVFHITIHQRGQKLELARDSATHKWDRENPARDAAIEETLYRLGKLTADDWSALGEREAALRGVSESKLQIILDMNEGGKPHQRVVTFGNLARSGQPYAAVTLEQGQPVTFKFPPKVYELVAQWLVIPPSTNEL